VLQPITILSSASIGGAVLALMIAGDSLSLGVLGRVLTAKPAQSPAPSQPHSAT
jgi:hypothetical protein